MAPPNWPRLVVEAAFTTSAAVQAGNVFILDSATNGKLDTNVLGNTLNYTDLAQWTQAGSISRSATRTVGPIWNFGQGTLSVNLRNDDGRFDPDNASGPYTSGGVTLLNAMVPIRVRAQWNIVSYPLFYGYADGWADDGKNYANHYAQVALGATDAEKVLSGINLPTTGAAGTGELSGARISRILDAAQFDTGSAWRQIGTGNSTMQGYVGGDSAWNLMQIIADSEIGELYVNGAGQVVFRGRQQILTDTRSNTSQATFSDNPATGVAYTSGSRLRDDATLANDIQGTRTGGSMQEVQDSASILTYRYPRSYVRTDLMLQDDPTVNLWAQWVLYISKANEARFDTLVINPLRDPANLWPQALGREIGDRITINRDPPGVAAFSKDCFIRGIEHAWDPSGSGNWTTTWTLQDASKYGSFLTLDNPILGRLNFNALAF